MSEKDVTLKLGGPPALIQEGTTFEMEVGPMKFAVVAIQGDLLLAVRQGGFVIQRAAPKGQA